MKNATFGDALFNVPAVKRGPKPRGGSRQVYKHFLDELRCAGSWFAKPLVWCRVFGSATSDFLLALLNASQIDPTGDAWVMFTESFVVNGIGMSPKAQNRAIDKLERMGVIEVKFRGRFRHLRIDLKALSEALVDTADEDRTARVVG